MLNEVKFSRYIETRANVTEVDLGDFIKCKTKPDAAFACGILILLLPPLVYVNHRPAFGLSPTQLGHAFKILGERVGKDQRWTIDRASFLSLLQEKGTPVFLTLPWGWLYYPKLLLTTYRRTFNGNGAGGVYDDTSWILWESWDRWLFYWGHWNSYY